MEEAQDRGVAVCVLGMSRSGTSLTTRILNLAGVYLGPEEGLLWHLPSNPAGHWESVAMLRFNEWLLRKLGGSWRDPPSMPPGWERSEVLAGERCAARGFLAQTFGGHELWGWKDPRNSLTLPFWQRLLPEVRYVVCLRNPIDVAASLDRREGFPAARAYELWLAYVDAALAGTAAGPRLVVAYEDYFEDWRAQAARLARFIDRSPPAPGSALDRSIEAAIEQGLRHHRTPAEAVLDAERIPAAVASTYMQARRLAAEPVAAET